MAFFFGISPNRANSSVMVNPLSPAEQAYFRAWVERETPAKVASSLGIRAGTVYAILAGAPQKAGITAILRLALQERAGETP